MKRVLYIDGSNLYGGQFELFGPSQYLIGEKFFQIVEDKLKVTFDCIYVYGSFSPIPYRPSKKKKDQLKNEALFYKSLRKSKKVIFFKGYRSPTSGKEKEVDVKLAVDIVDMAHRNEFDEMFLLSGDADFMHALNIVKTKRKRITILALPNRIPFRFIHHFKTVIFGEEKVIKKHSLLKKTKNIICQEIDYLTLLGRI